MEPNYFTIYPYRHYHLVIVIVIITITITILFHLFISFKIYQFIYRFIDTWTYPARRESFW